jgi:hypothetical protein
VGWGRRAALGIGEVVSGDGAWTRWYIGMNPGDGEQLHCSRRRARPYALDAATGGEHRGQRRVESELWRRRGAARGWVGAEPNFVQLIGNLPFNPLSDGLNCLSD